MSSLQKALGKDEQFFDLLEASAAEASASAQALARFALVQDHTRSLDEFAASRRKEKQINAQIAESLATQVMTTFEREDVEALSKSLYKIPKTVEKIGERILLAPEHLEGVDMSPEISSLEKATAILGVMIHAMRNGAPIPEMKEHNANLQHIEGEVDKMMVGQLRALYHMDKHPGRVAFLKDLHELLERATDRCRDAGNTIIQIVLKNA